MSRFKAFSVIIHIAGWLLFMAFPLVFLNSHGEDSSNWVILQKSSYWMFCYTYIFLFYSNAYYFIPLFFLKKKYVQYSIVVLVLLAGVSYLKPFDRLLHSTDSRTNMQMQSQGPGFNGPPANQGGPGGPPPGGGPGQQAKDGRNQPPPPSFQPNQGANGNMGPNRQQVRRRPIDSSSLFIFVMIMALSTAIITVQQWQATEQRATQAEADKASAELSFLKAQINPHFLFNTLNNIYTLAVTKDDNAPDSIMKLSNIMRYVTDDVVEDFVPLKSEIDCISDYIELQKLRIGQNTQITYTVNGNINGKKIAPLVLMTFIENVFKYGISKHENSDIDISINTNGNDISFFCRNRIFTGRAENQRTGIGIKNTKQRLAYLYPNKHLLNISSENDEYTVQLTLQA
jgi:hypothetical protein